MTDDAREWTRFGRYTLLDRIGCGGMAEIFRAKTFGAAGFEKEFAIKLILPALLDDSEFVAMFINEAKIAGHLYHPNIVQVFDLGELDGQYFIAMEFVHGKDLLDILARATELGIKLPLDLAIHVTMELLKGLEFAHHAKNVYGEDLHIIHRDVSPSNVLVSYSGEVKIGDFGVAKAAIQRPVTESGTLKGKVGYMSPEQVVGESIDARSDVFSAGIVFFESLAMARMFTGKADLDVMLRVRNADIQSSILKAGPFPGDLLHILQKALARQRDDRYQTAGQFYEALVDFCFRHGIKTGAQDLSNFMRRVFLQDIEREKQRRRQEGFGGLGSAEAASPPAILSPGEDHLPVVPIGTDPSLGQDDRPTALPGHATDQHEVHRHEALIGASYRLRDLSGVVFGPMDLGTLAVVLSQRPDGLDHCVAVDNGPWQKVHMASDLIEAILQAGDAVDFAGERAVGAQAAEPLAALEVRAVREGLRSLDDVLPADQLAEISSALATVPPLEWPSGEPTPREIHVLKAQYATYEGSLETMSLARVLARLYLSRATGRLVLVHGGRQKTVFLREGEPQLVISNEPAERLGSLLVARGLVSEPNLEQALERQRQWGGRIGDALVASGALQATQLYGLLVDQLRHRLLDVFTWMSGHYSFYENQHPSGPVTSLGLDTVGLIAEACRTLMPLRRLRQFYESRKAVAFHMRDRWPVSAARIGLTDAELALLALIQPSDTLRAWFRRMPADERERALRTIFLLHKLEAVRFETTQHVVLPKQARPWSTTVLARVGGQKGSREVAGEGESV